MTLVLRQLDTLFSFLCTLDTRKHNPHYISINITQTGVVIESMQLYICNNKQYYKRNLSSICRKKLKTKVPANNSYLKIHSVASSPGHTQFFNVAC